MPEYESGLAGPVFADGVYDFKVIDAGEKNAEKSGNPMIELQLDVMNADFTDKVRVVDRLVFTPSSYWKIDSFRKATGEKILQNQKVRFEAEDCIDRTGRLALKTTVYNGKPRNEVDFYVEPEEQPTGTAGAPQPQPAAAAAQPAAKGTVPKPGQSF